MLQVVAFLAEDGTTHRRGHEGPRIDVGGTHVEGQLPRFDLVFLGLGPEAHTASLFPGTQALHEAKRLVVSNWVGKFFTDRITMTPPVLNNAACVIFLVSGEEKALPLKAVREGKYEPEQLPAQLIQPKHGRLLWLVDQVAASLLQTDQR